MSSYVVDILDTSTLPHNCVVQKSVAGAESARNWLQFQNLLRSNGGESGKLVRELYPAQIVQTHNQITLNKGDVVLEARKVSEPDSSGNWGSGFAFHIYAIA